MNNAATKLCSLPTGTKIIRRADYVDWQVDRDRVLLVEKPDGTVWWIRTDGTEQRHIRDN